MRAPLDRLRGAASGFALPLEGLGLLRRERSLWAFAALPFAISTVALLAAGGAVIVFAGDLHGLVAGWLPELHADDAWQWIWVGPGRAVLWAFGSLLFALSALAVMLAALLLASLLAAPFHEALSRRVELVVEGRVDEVEEPGVWPVVREGGRAVLEEGRRLAFFLALWGTVALLGVVVPGGQVLAPPLLALLTLLFLPLDYASYVLDRRRLSFREKRAWLFGHAHAMLGFGAAAAVLIAIPGVNLLAMPVLVVAGTLLALRHPMPPAAPGASTGTATSP